MKALPLMLPTRYRPAAKQMYHSACALVAVPLSPLRKFVKTPLMLAARHSRAQRKLEIGPGTGRIDGFETLNVVAGPNVDYVWDASKRLPFRTGTFELIYASHVLEHIPWYKTSEVLAEWVRLLAPGGRLEIWVPDGLKICKAFVDAEQNGAMEYEKDGWYRFNELKDPCLWASGRVFSYGDGAGTPGHPNWHLALFSYRYLEHALRGAGCLRAERLPRSQVRGYDHGWINLGIVGVKG